MQASSARVGCLIALASVGCSSKPVPSAEHLPSASALDGLFKEGQALGNLFAPGQLLFTAALVAAAFGVNVLIRTGVKFGWRLGFDGERKWARVSGLLRVGIAVLVSFVILRETFAVAPTLASAFTLFCVWGALFFSGFMANVFVGARLTLGRRIREGDRVKIGAHEGVVREVGFSQLYLRAADGASTLIPNRLLNELPVVVERARNSVPVRVRLSLERRADATQLERLRQVAALCPYRAPESLVDISRSAEDERQITVEIQVWSARASRDAQAQLEAALRRALE